MLQNDALGQPPGLFATLTDRLGTLVAGDTPPSGFRLYVANALIQRVGGTVYFGEDGKATPVPEPLIVSGIYPRGVSNLRVSSAEDGRTTYSFSRNIRFRVLGMTRHSTSDTQITV